VTPRARARSPAVARLAAVVLRFIEPDDNPSGVVYGTIAVGAVLAAESTRRETYGDTIAATVLVLVLYWLAHTYATVVGDRLAERQTLTARRLWRAFVHEAALVKGAALPIALLVVLWMTSVSLVTGLNAALWTCAADLVVFEVVATVRSRATGILRFGEVALGVALGAGILVVRVVLH
jgi:hypothetical protein